MLMFFKSVFNTLFPRNFAIGFLRALSKLKQQKKYNISRKEYKLTIE